MPKVLGWPHQESMGPGGLVVLAEAGIEAAPTSEDWAVAVVVRLVAGHSVVAVCWVAGWVPEACLTVPRHHH